MNSSAGPPITLGNTANAKVRLIVWCRDCAHQVEPDPTLGQRSGLRAWRARLSGCDGGCRNFPEVPECTAITTCAGLCRLSDAFAGIAGSTSLRPGSILCCDLACGVVPGWVPAMAFSAYAASKAVSDGCFRSMISPCPEAKMMASSGRTAS